MTLDKRAANTADELQHHEFHRSAFVVPWSTLPGSSFAFVMASGIVSIASLRLGHREIAAALFAVNLVAFPLLCLLMLVRLLQHPAAVLAELCNHRTGAGFLTTVAATCILGNQFVLVASNRDVAAALWLASLVLWVGLIYAFFVAMTIRPLKPPLATGLDGAWLLTVVASEAVAILATHAASVLPRADIVVFAGLCFFLLGGALYFLVISLIVQRWLFEPLRPKQLTLPYWINMGAAAITALAGTRFLSIAGSDPLAAGLAQLITAAALLFWAIATWWIPLLAALMVWRHVVHRIPPTFRIEYWSMVFPLGMYTAATWDLSRQSGFEFLTVIPRVALWIALASWLLGCVGVAWRFLRLLSPAQATFKNGNAEGNS
jgi:tellurite resistance protein TehA-like permease